MSLTFNHHTDGGLVKACFDDLTKVSACLPQCRQPVASDSIPGLRFALIECPVLAPQIPKVLEWTILSDDDIREINRSVLIALALQHGGNHGCNRRCGAARRCP